MNKITNNFYYIQNKLMENNSFILIDKNYCFIVDPSWNNKELINFINTKKLTLQGIIFTHLHFDHVGNALDILDALNCNKIFVSKNGDKIINGNLDRLFINNTKFKELDIQYVDDNTEIANGQIKFLLTPGHSTCSMCVIWGEHIKTGDHIFLEDIGRTDLKYGNVVDMDESIKKFVKYVQKNNIKFIYPGHGPFGEIKKILETNNYLIKYILL